MMGLLKGEEALGCVSSAPSAAGCRCRTFSYLTWSLALLCPYLGMKAEVEEGP